MLITDIQTFTDELDKLPDRIRKRVEAEWKPVEGFCGAWIMIDGSDTHIKIVTLDWIIEVYALGAFYSGRKYSKSEVIENYNLITKLEESKNENS